MNKRTVTVWGFLSGVQEAEIAHQGMSMDTVLWFLFFILFSFSCLLFKFFFHTTSHHRLPTSNSHQILIYEFCFESSFLSTLPRKEKRGGRKGKKENLKKKQLIRCASAPRLAWGLWELVWLLTVSTSFLCLPIVCISCCWLAMGGMQSLWVFPLSWAAQGRWSGI